MDCSESLVSVEYTVSRSEADAASWQARIERELATLVAGLPLRAPQPPAPSGGCGHAAAPNPHPDWWCRGLDRVDITRVRTRFSHSVVGPSRVESRCEFSVLLTTQE